MNMQTNWLRKVPWWKGNQQDNCRYICKLIIKHHIAAQQELNEEGLLKDKLYQNIKNRTDLRCVPGGSMCTCHAAGPGLIPGQDKFPG